MFVASKRVAGRLFALLVLVHFVAAPAFAQPAPPRPTNGAAPAPEAAASAPTEGEPAPEPPSPKPGHVVIESDADGLVAEVAGAVHGLKIGANRIEVAAGDWTVAVRDKAGKAVGSWSVHVDPEGEAKVTVVTTGEVVIPVSNGRVVEINGKAVEAKNGEVRTRLPAGKASVVVKEPGKVGIKGDVEVTAGKSASIDPKLEHFEPGNKTLAWVGIVGGGALVLAGTLMEPFVDASAAGGDATRWAMVGVGTAAFVGGTILMKDILAKENAPPVKDGSFDVRLSGGRRGGMATFALRF
ncbi:MAG: hypothetical protein RIT45_2527 [Pseudomonadota bacterium]|jgi:hypothetical protein